ncbi:MAG: ABC transporter ATP-binding protein [Candidatus Sericytochromatia bacterium]|nr:ABC transporter ATP-binding protein [Candidatus Sericytochromatia bacterium]
MLASPLFESDPLPAVAMSPDRLLHVLVSLSADCSLDLDLAVADTALRKALETGHSRTLAEWIEILRRVGATVGLGVHGVRRTLAEAMTSANPAAPWLTVASGGDIAGSWVAILQRRGQSVRLRNLEDDREYWISVDDLVGQLGGGPDAAWLWLIAEPVFPLAPLRDPGDGSAMGRLLALVRTEVGDIAVVTAYAVAIGILSLVVPLTVQSLVNTVAFGALLQPLVVLTLVVLLALGAAAGLRVIQTHVVEMLQRRLFVRTAIDLAYRLPRVALGGYGKYHGPEMVNRFFDVLTLQKAASGLLLDGLGVVLTTLIGMVLLAFYHPLLLAFDVVLVIGIAIILVGLGRNAIVTSIKESHAKYAVAGWLEELARHPLAFKSVSASHYALQQSESLVRTYLSARDKHYRVFRRQLIGSLGLQVLASAVLLGLGGWLVIERQLTLGQLVAAELVVTKVVEGFAKLSKHLEMLYDLLAAVDKLGSLVDLPLDRFGGVEMPDTAAAVVALRQVTIVSKGEGVAVRDADMFLQAGSRVALTVNTGSGLRPLIDVLTGFGVPSAGAVELDGRDTRELDLGEMRGRVAVVRDVEIFGGTIAGNVSVGRPDAAPAEIRQALAAVDLLQVALELPDGLQTLVKTGGAPLTNDQALRLMVARAIVSQPRLLVLDETLDVLGTAARQMLLATLCLPDNPWTLLIVTQREDVMAYCDTVYALEGGTVRLVRQFDLGGS